MNLFLCDLHENTNENLQELLNSYQDYFVFIQNKHKISLYLDVNNLKKIGINLLDDYETLGIIDLQKYTKNNNWNFIVWKPKK